MEGMGWAGSKILSMWSWSWRRLVVNSFASGDTEGMLTFAWNSLCPICKTGVCRAPPGLTDAVRVSQLGWSIKCNHHISSSWSLMDERWWKFRVWPIQTCSDNLLLWHMLVWPRVLQDRGRVAMSVLLRISHFMGWDHDGLCSWMQLVGA